MKIPHFFLVSLVMMLTGCRQIAAVTPETQVINKVLSSQAVARINPLSIEVLAKQSFKEHVFVLVQYEVNDTQDDQSVCRRLFDTFQDKNRLWTTKGGITSCSSLGPYGFISPWISSGTETLAGPDGADFSYASGLTSTDAVSVKITWADGMTQTVTPNKRVYLVIREGDSQWQSIEALDKDGSVLHRDEYPAR